jgi:Na+-driven multidrug efflux pump
MLLFEYLWRNKIMSKDEYLITDAPLKALTIFAMPMILGSFFQQVYNMADSIIVGQFVGSSALAAVGACAALTNVFICVALGAGVGAGVLVSRYFGARNYGKMKTIVSTSLISFLSLSILLSVLGFCFSDLMMRLLHTPADILDDAVLRFLRALPLKSFTVLVCDFANWAETAPLPCLILKK